MPNSLARWFYKDKYSKINVFKKLDERILDRSIIGNDSVSEFILNKGRYKKILNALKSNEIMRKPVYEITIVKYLYENYDEYELAIETMAF